MFFPVGKSGPALLQIAAAQTICRGCPVKDECLEWALDAGCDDGVFGGLTAPERRKLRPPDTPDRLARRAVQRQQETVAAGEVRGLCPGCRESRRLRVGGLLVTHGKCPGGGQWPVPARVMAS